MKNKPSTFNLQLSTDSRGIAAMLTIVIVGIAALIISFSASILGLGELDMGYTDQRGDEAFYVADGCVEEALRRIKLDVGYTGETLNLGDSSCIIGVTGAGTSRTVIATSTVSDYYKVVKTDITLSVDAIPNITIDLWVEVSD